MGRAIRGSLPLAIGIALSPAAITAVVLMLTRCELDLVDRSASVGMRGLCACCRYLPGRQA